MTELAFLAFALILIARLVVEVQYQRSMDRLRERVAGNPALSEAHAVATRAFLDCGYAPGFAEESALLVIAEVLIAEGERVKLAADFKQMRATAAECGAANLVPRIDEAERVAMQRLAEAT